nr:ribosomal protein L18 [Madagascaria erythrocladioides]
MQTNRKKITANKHARIRIKIKGTNIQPRLCVFRSNKHIYAQLIDDNKQKTLTASSTIDPEIKSLISTGNNCEAAKVVGEMIAKKSLNLGINRIVFDRGGKLYHGRIKVLADAARSKGLKF